MIIKIGESMFGAEYSRMKFWLLSIPIFLVGSIVMELTRAVAGDGAGAIPSLVFLVILTHVLANRIRGFGSNPWLALWALLPLVGLFQAFYYGCKKSGKIPKEES